MPTIRIEERYTGVAVPRPLEPGEHEVSDRIAAYFVRTFSGPPFYAKLVNPPAQPEAPAPVEVTPEETAKDETAQEPAAVETTEEGTEETEGPDEPETVAQTMVPAETQIVQPVVVTSRPKRSRRRSARSTTRSK